jgi:hypothetical protein
MHDSTRNASSSRFASLIIVAVAMIVLPALRPTHADAGGDWNDAAIDWQSYEDGLLKAKSGSIPVCLVFYTDWCPHCAGYSKVFHDPTVVEMSKRFVMIRVERDGNREISKNYAPDGEYIPRTHFLTPEGEIRPEIHEKRATYLYFFDESDPQGLLGGTREALGEEGKVDLTGGKP